MHWKAIRMKHAHHCRIASQCPKTLSDIHNWTRIEWFGILSSIPGAYSLRRFPGWELCNFSTIDSSLKVLGWNSFASRRGNLIVERGIIRHLKGRSATDIENTKVCINIQEAIAAPLEACFSSFSTRHLFRRRAFITIAEPSHPASISGSQ